MFNRIKKDSSQFDKRLTRAEARKLKETERQLKDSLDGSIIQQPRFWDLSLSDQTLRNDPFSEFSLVNSTIQTVSEHSGLEDTLSDSTLTGLNESANKTVEHVNTRAGEIRGQNNAELSNHSKQPDREPVNVEGRAGAINNCPENPRLPVMAATPAVALKDAISVVPEFDGSNIPVSEFLEGCDEAKAMIENDAEAALTKMIRMKLKGEARGAITGQAFDNVESLKVYIKSIFVPPKSVYQLLGELGYEYQREGEGVISFANRIKELGKLITEAEIVNSGNVTADFTTKLQANQLECFKRGLKMEISHRLPSTITAATMVTAAIKVEREIEAQKALRRLDIGTTRGASHPGARKNALVCQLCKLEGHEADRCGRINHDPCKICNRTNHSTERCRLNQTNQRQSQMKCQLCNKEGHSAVQCTTISRCQLCNQVGHTALLCGKGEQRRVSCQICGKTNHTAANCFQLNRPQDRNNRLPIAYPAATVQNQAAATSAFSNTSNEITCNYCRKPGHFLRECKLRIENNARRAGNDLGVPTKSATSEHTSQMERSTNLILTREAESLI